MSLGLLGSESVIVAKHKHISPSAEWKRILVILSQLKVHFSHPSSVDLRAHIWFCCLRVYSRFWLYMTTALGDKTNTRLSYGSSQVGLVRRVPGARPPTLCQSLIYRKNKKDFGLLMILGWMSVTCFGLGFKCQTCEDSSTELQPSQHQTER